MWQKKSIVYLFLSQWNQRKKFDAHLYKTGFYWGRLLHETKMSQRARFGFLYINSSRLCCHHEDLLDPPGLPPIWAWSPEAPRPLHCVLQTRFTVRCCLLVSVTEPIPTLPWWWHYHLIGLPMTISKWIS